MTPRTCVHGKPVGTCYDCKRAARKAAQRRRDDQKRIQEMNEKGLWKTLFGQK